MTLPFRRFVRVESSVGGATTIARRELSGLLITTLPLAPVGSILEFDSAAAVADHFGSASSVADRARFYFSYIDPNGGKPNKLLVGRWAKEGAAPTIFGAPRIASVTRLAQVSAGILTLIVNGTTVDVPALSFTDQTSFAGIAGIIQTAVRAASPQLNSATVEYDAVAQRYIIAMGTTAPGTLVAGGNTANPDNVGPLLGVGPGQVGVVNSEGSAVQSPAEALAAAIDISDNFGSIVFDGTYTLPEYIAAAQLNAGYDVSFMLLGRVTTQQVEEWGPACVGIASQGLTHYNPALAQYPEMLPMCQLAATDYDRPNASTNYMFRNNSGSMLSATVFSTTVANRFEALRVNFIGETQNAGQKVAFYMPGLLGGGANAIVDMGVHANEQWLKTVAISELGNLLINSSRIPANEQGRSQIMAVLQAVVQSALENGVISVGKELTEQQRAFIIQRTNDIRSPIQVQTAGFWLNVAIRSEVDGSGNARMYAAYVLIYSKDDAIRRIEGTHNLI